MYGHRDALAWVEAATAAEAVRRSLELHPFGAWSDDAIHLIVLPPRCASGACWAARTYTRGRPGGEPLTTEAPSVQARAVAPPPGDLDSSRPGHHDPRRPLWEPQITLAQDYYDPVTERPVQLDMTHLVALARSPRRMDGYAWLIFGTAAIAEGDEVRMRLAALKRVFAPDIEDFHLFKQRFRSDLAAVGRIYGGFRVIMVQDLVVLK